MQIQQFKKEFFNKLNELYPTTEIQSFFNLLLEFKLKLSRIEVALQPDFEVSKTDLIFLKKALKDLTKHIPIQYITGETEFYGLPFKVNKNVLIPRPETEELVSWIIEELKVVNPKSKSTILDIGTGSGCIPISLAKNVPNATIYALDISTEALKTAKKNAELNTVTINFIEADILNLKELPKQFDIIVSNPPYVRALEKEQMQKNVLNNEPHVALFVEDNNPLLFYDKISDLANNYLSKDGHIYFEINQYLGKETADLLSEKGFKNIVLKKDMFGADRMIRCRF
ncbi:MULTISPECIES: peptide chain release factor N(5)-glutamine methyltransferase [Flavobacteriaceae]|uniref:Release factor glutamine methyltransferase n=2 Tax=Flavobacteriaceae TaxID=49546 RepID=A0A4Y8AX37_9FLAO|nr:MULTISPECIES: peptide chain release factor N(5)-glutamine methyltransferase [Flavobacteriaceae]TEW77090.1 peptide chain release factor N(5)-glutamine methyltransferase [Gramella jeungdoensis]GGK57974.1 release factor glutamine methyltransferase [Lutibacter litoralis]